MFIFFSIIVKNMPKIQYNSGNGIHFIVIPKRILELKGWKKGDKINIREDNFGNLVLVAEKKINQ